MASIAEMQQAVAAGADYQRSDRRNRRRRRLTPANVGGAIAQVRPFGVDLCSGFRTAGPLDTAKLVAFVAAVRAVDQAGLYGPVASQPGISSSISQPAT